MTITTAPIPQSFLGDGLVTAFPIPWKYFAKSDVVVTLRDSSNVEALQVITTHYTLTAAGVATGGTCTMVIPPANNETLVISLDPPNTQASPIPLGGSLPSPIIEAALDKLTQLVANLDERFNRAMLVPKTDTQIGDNLALPIDADRAGKFLSADSNGKIIFAAGTSANLGPVSAYVDTLLDDADAVTFRQTLLLDKSGADIASAATIDLDASTGDFVDVTGNVTITAITLGDGVEKTVRFTGALILTDGASLVLPGNANITTVAGDIAVFRGDASSVVRLVQYQRISGSPVITSPYQLNNLGLNSSVSGNDLTLTVLTRALATPSADGPVEIAFRNTTAATGDYVIRTVTAALSIIIEAGETLGFSNATAGFIYLYAIDNAGTVELAVAKKAIFHEGLQHTTTALTASSDDDSTLYSTTARTSVAVRLIGRFRVTHGAAVWDAAPTEEIVWTPDMKKTGDVVQSVITIDPAVATGSTQMPWDDTIPQNTEGFELITRAITPTDAENRLEIEAQLLMAISAGGNLSFAIFQDSTAGALAVMSQYIVQVNNSTAQSVSHEMSAGTTSSTTFKVRTGLNGAFTGTFNGQVGSRLFGGVAASFLRVTEIQA